MKKFFILSLVAMLAMTGKSFAQTALTATLLHEGKISAFYGTTALKEAYNAAADNDIITLSSGSFSAVDIDKELTIRGAGMEPNAVTGTLPTILAGDFSVKKTITLEGIYSDYKITVMRNTDSGVQTSAFIKCRMNTVELKNNDSHLTFMNCRITSQLYNTTQNNNSWICINSIIRRPLMYPYPTYSSYYDNSFNFSNCIIYSLNELNNGYDLRDSYLNNCIIIGANAALDASNQVYNCVVVTENGSTNALDKVTNNTSTVVEGYANLFETFTGTFDDNEKFILKEEAKKKYLGLDGTEVGIYGGSFPFDPTTLNPQITKCNVASKSTVDGKLSVDIEVNGAQ